MSKDIVKALVTKKFSEAKELVFQSLYAKTALAMDDARMGVASSVFNAPAEQVEEGTAGIYDDDDKMVSKPVIKSGRKTGVPAGASRETMAAARRANPYRAKLGKGVPAGAKVEEDFQTDARVGEMGRKIDRADLAAGRFMDPDNKRGLWKKGKPKSRAALKKGKRLEKAYTKLVAKDDREAASKKTFGRSGKVIK